MRAEDESMDILLYFRLVYGSEFDAPREAAFDHIVKLALMDADRPLSLKETVKKIENTKGLPPLRQKTVEESLTRLAKRKAVKVDYKKTPQYYQLRENEKRELDRFRLNRQYLLSECTRTFVKEVAKKHTLTPDMESKLGDFFQKTLFQIFGRFGLSCAQWISHPADQTHRIQILTGKEVCDIMFKNAKSVELYDDEVYPTAEKEFIACFTKKRDSEFSQLFFDLSQSSYILNLIGISPAALSLTKAVFEGYNVYLDSNLIISSILKEHEYHTYTEELLGITKELDIRRIVAEPTVEEIKGVVAKRRDDVLRYAEVDIPEEYLHEIYDEFYVSYWHRKKANPDYKPEDLLAPFDTLEETLHEHLGVDIDSSSLYNELLRNKGKMRKVGNVVAQKYEEIKMRTVDKIDSHEYRFLRWKPKKEFSIEHDALLYLAIQELRKSNKKIILLTRDKSLPLVSEALQSPHEQPYCFTLDIWLQTLSPFIARKPGIDFTSLFLEALSSDLLTFGPKLGPRDFIFLHRIGVDVSQIPEEYREEVLQEVRTTMGKGQALDEESLHRQLSYNISTLLADIAQREDERVSFLEGKLIDFHNKYAEQKEELERIKAERNETKDELQKLRDVLAPLKDQIDAFRKERRLEKISTLKKKRKRGLVLRWIFAVLVWLIVLFLFGIPWVFPVEISLPTWIHFAILIVGILAGAVIALWKNKKLVLKLRFRFKIWRLVGRIIIVVFALVSGVAGVLYLIEWFSGKQQSP